MSNIEPYRQAPTPLATRALNRAMTALTWTVRGLAWAAGAFTSLIQIPFRMGPYGAPSTFSLMLASGYVLHYGIAHGLIAMIIMSAFSAALFFGLTIAHSSSRWETSRNSHK